MKQLSFNHNRDAAAFESEQGLWHQADTQLSSSTQS